MLLSRGRAKNRVLKGESEGVIRVCELNGKSARLEDEGHFNFWRFGERQTALEAETWIWGIGLLPSAFGAGA